MNKVLKKLDRLLDPLYLSRKDKSKLKYKQKMMLNKLNIARQEKNSHSRDRLYSEVDSIASSIQGLLFKARKKRKGAIKRFYK